MNKENNTNELTYEAKKAVLEEILDNVVNKDVMVAFSGGVDSSALLKLVCSRAVAFHTTVYAVTIHTKLHPVGEIEEAAKVAGEIGAVHKVVEVDELAEAGILNNPVNRCYLCKHCLFTRVKELAEKLGVTCMMDGTNYSDLFVYRPGLQALKELGVLSPLKEAGFTKADVRRLAAEYGLSVSDKPAMPCLATRFPYNTPLSYEKMHQADVAEKAIRALGFYNVRVRVHNDIARIEVDAKDLEEVLKHRETIVSKLKDCGFDYVTLDLEGFCSGSMDKKIAK